MPSWVQEEPAASWAEDAVIAAFFALSSCRAFVSVVEPGGARVVPGPLPWTAIVLYVERLGLPADTIDPVVRAVQELDDAYLEQLPKPKPVKLGKDGRRRYSRRELSEEG